MATAPSGLELGADYWRRSLPAAPTLGPTTVVPAGLAGAELGLLGLGATVTGVSAGFAEEPAGAIVVVTGVTGVAGVAGAAGVMVPETTLR